MSNQTKALVIAYNGMQKLLDLSKVFVQIYVKEVTLLQNPDLTNIYFLPSWALFTKIS